MNVYEEIDKINRAIASIERRLNKARTAIFAEVQIYDTDESNILTLDWAEDDSADRALDFKVNSGNRIIDLSENLKILDGQDIELHASGGEKAQLALDTQNAERTLDLSGDLTVELDSVLNQDLSSDASPAFANLSLGTGELTAGKISRASGTLRFKIGETSLISILSTYVNVKKNLFVNETANAKMTKGITINMGGADNEVLAFKSSDIGHGITDFAETDTFCNFVKAGAMTGGVAIQAFTGGTTAFQMAGVGTTANTAKTTGGNAYVYFFGYEKSGTGIGNASANANIFALGTYKDNGYKTIFIVDEDGDYHYDGADGGAFQNENDIALLKELEDILTKDKLNKKEAKKKDIYKKHKVVELGESDEDEGRFVSNKKKTMLILGAIRQLDKRLKVLEN